MQGPASAPWDYEGRAGGGGAREEGGGSFKVSVLPTNSHQSSMASSSCYAQTCLAFPFPSPSLSLTLIMRSMRHRPR